MKTYLILGLVFMLVLAGCTTSAEQSEYDYVPQAGAGCGFSADYNQDSVVENNEKLVEQTTTKQVFNGFF
jgi:hypothetical protein